MGASVHGHSLRAHLYVGHVAAHEVEAEALLDLGVVVAHVVPDRGTGSGEVHAPVAIVVEALVELVPGEGPEDAGHALRPGDAVVPPDIPGGVHAAVVQVDLESAVGRRHGRRRRLVAVGVDKVNELTAPGCTPFRIRRLPEEDAAALRLGDLIGEEGRPAGERNAVDRRPVGIDIIQDALLHLLMEVRGVIHDVRVLPAEPLEQPGLRQGDFGEAVGVGDDVHADGAAGGVDEVAHGAELPRRR